MGGTFLTILTELQLQSSIISTWLNGLWEYKAYVLPHLEYCCPLLLGISKVLKNNIERTNRYAIKTLLNLGNSATYDFCLAMADMDKLEQCFKLDGPNYISKFFTPRLTKYNLRDSGLNVMQPPYNSLVMHNSFLFTITHIWNQLPTVTKSSTTLAQFRARLNNVNFTGYQCIYLFLHLYILLVFLNICIYIIHFLSCFVFFSLSSVFNMSLWLGRLCKHFPRLRH